MTDKTAEGGALVTAPPEQEQGGELTADRNGSAPVLDITVSLDNLLIGDLESLEAAGKKQLPTKEMLDFLDRIVIGQDIRKLPLSALGQIIEQLGQATKDAANPGN